MVPCKGGFDNSPLPFHTLIGTILILPIVLFVWFLYFSLFWFLFSLSCLFLCYCAIVLFCYFPCFDSSRAQWWFALLDSGSPDITLIGQLPLARLPVTWSIHGCHESWLSISGKSTGPWRSRRWRHRNIWIWSMVPLILKFGILALTVTSLVVFVTSPRTLAADLGNPLPPLLDQNNNKAIWYSMVPGNSMKRCCCSDSLIIKHTWQVVRQILCPWSWRTVSMWMISLENPTPWNWACPPPPQSKV